MANDKRHERLIFDNRSSKPLYESYEKAFDFYFQEWSEEYKSQAMTWGDGSTGQMKFEAHPLLPHYDKLQRTLLMQFEALGLNYSTTPSKVKEDTKRGVDAERDGLMSRISEVQGTMNEIPDEM